jgi:hypothetical protein
VIGRQAVHVQVSYATGTHSKIQDSKFEIQDSRFQTTLLRPARQAISVLRIALMDTWVAHRPGQAGWRVLAGEEEREFFFSTFEAGMLLKTKGAPISRRPPSGNVYESN